MEFNVEKLVPLVKDKLDFENLTAVTKTNQQNVAVLESTIDKIDRQNHSNNLVLDGVPSTNNENLFHIIYGIADHLAVNMSEYDLNTVFRLKTSRKVSSIIVCFQSKYVRDRIFSTYMHKSVNLEDIGFRGMKGRVYLNEHLTPKYAHIFGKCRLFKQQNLIHKCYTLNGIPYIIHKADEKPLRIISEIDLDIFVNENSIDLKLIEGRRLENSTQMIRNSNGELNDQHTKEKKKGG